MLLFRWQQLPLLMLIQLLEPNTTSHKLYVEAFIASKSTSGTTQYSSCSTGRYPWLRQRENDQSSVSLRAAATDGGNNGVPTITPLQPAGDKRASKLKIAAIVGGAGSALIVIVIVVLVYTCLMRIKKFTGHESETASSAPVPPTDLAKDNISPYAATLSPVDTKDLRQLSVVELGHATSNFSQSNIIGEGTFGLVYKGLLLDGSIVAIKRCLHRPVRDFVHEVKHLASVHHKHLVNLIGYCEDQHQQFLAYDYISNGNVGNYLYDSEGLPIGRLAMRQRLLIALGAAKGLQYIHSLAPPLLHMHFRTSNVLLSDNFIAKVSDYGLVKLVTESYRAGSSSAIDYFLDPELNSSEHFSEANDVYSFGVFLLELMSGRQAHGKFISISGHSLINEAREQNPENFIDKTIRDQTTEAARQMMEVALLCVDNRAKRPSMARVVEEIEQIQRDEMGYLETEFGEEIGCVKLGSELFK